MCCIFTCCGWMIDLVQRLWTFTMSCCISSAVCCLMVTGSMSGIALGYNYSLAEYIDLKETNVSVYLKRGVFDDEIADDMDWRRSGRMPVAGHIGTDNLRTGAPPEDDSTPLQSGRRLDDSVFESDDPNKYEGSLMRLTAQPPYPGTTKGTTDTPDYVEGDSNFARGSLDQLKAIQGMISARKSAMGSVKPQQKTTYPDIDERYLARLPPNPNLPPEGRRMMQPESNMIDRLNPARLAVPGEGIGSEENWIYPKDPVKYRQRFSYSDIDYPDFDPKYPKPIRLHTGPIRPPKPTATPEMRTYKSEEVEISKPRIPLISIKPEFNSALKSFKEKMILQKFEAPEYPRKSKDSSDDYEEDVKGLPVRRRRSITSDNSAKIVEKKESTQAQTDSTLVSHEIVNRTEILNSNNNLDEVSVETEHSTISNEDTLSIFSQDSIEKAKKTLVADEIDITTKTSTLQYKLIAKLTNKKMSEDPAPKKDNDIENISYVSQNTLDKVWNSFPDKSGKDWKLIEESESVDMMADAAKTLNTIGISINDIKPSIMVKILQSAVV